MSFEEARPGVLYNSGPRRNLSATFTACRYGGTPGGLEGSGEALGRSCGIGGSPTTSGEEGVRLTERPFFVEHQKVFFCSSDMCMCALSKPPRTYTMHLREFLGMRCPSPATRTIAFSSSLRSVFYSRAVIPKTSLVVDLCCARTRTYGKNSGLRERFSVFVPDMSVIKPLPVYGVEGASCTLGLVPAACRRCCARRFRGHLTRSRSRPLLTTPSRSLPHQSTRSTPPHHHATAPHHHTTTRHLPPPTCPRPREPPPAVCKRGGARHQIQA